MFQYSDLTGVTHLHATVGSLNVNMCKVQLFGSKSSNRADEI